MENLQLKRLRRQAGYKTQNDFADALGMKPRKYASWERGEVKLDLEDACMLADVLACTLDELAGREFDGEGYLDPRQQAMNKAFKRLDEPLKTAAADAVIGMAGGACARDVRTVRDIGVSGVA